MSRPDESVLDRLRQPEYTGDDRCLPCTVLNVAVAVVVSALLGRRQRALGILVLGVSLAAIYLRGYLVPGTPELTDRYLPESVRRSIGKDPVAERLEDEFVTEARGTGATHAGEATGSESHDGDAATGTGTETDQDELLDGLAGIQERHRTEVEPVSYLESAGVIEPSPAASSVTDGYAFTEAVAATARERLPEDVESVGPERIAPLFGADPADLEPKDRDYPAYRVGVRVRKWPSVAAAALDVASFEAVGEYADDWDEVPVEQRADAVEWLRGFYEDCPVCGGGVAFSDDVIESCCGQFQVTTLSCSDCGVHLREFDPAKVGTRGDLKGIVP